VKTPKLISLSLFGLVLNAIFNGIFILLIARESDSQLLAKSMVIWSGFFVAGACIAPFENYFLYRRIDNAAPQRQGRVILLSCTVFLFVGLSICISQKVTLWTLPLTLTAGLCTGKMVHLRARAISEGHLTRVSLSNAIEGLARATMLMFWIHQYEKLTFLQILISYIAGNFISLIPYLGRENREIASERDAIPHSKIYGFAIIGFLTSLMSGGLPYVAGYFNAESISATLFFFTLSRSLLILQSILVYVKPNYAKQLGNGNSSKILFVYAIPLFTLGYLILSLFKYSVETILAIDLSSISHVDLIWFVFGLVLSAFFALKISTKNATDEWRYALISSVFGVLAACLPFILRDSGTTSFHTAMILAPLTGILTLAQLDKRREIRA
jgi:hypothetical protein